MNVNAMASKITNSAAPMEKLMDELRSMVADAEELLQATASQTGETAAIARSRIEKSLCAVKGSLREAETAVVERTRQAVKVTDQFIHDNPWQSIGVGACAGVVIGMLIARR
jgi:ElaB/YqjD/DUF883 family membrane-anchored ribosome-binding protein